MGGEIFWRPVPAGVFLLALLFLICVPQSQAIAAAPDQNYPSITLWPIAYHYEDVNRARTDVLWPIYHQKRKGSHTRTAIRPFIFNYETDPQRNFKQVNLLWPFIHFEYEADHFKQWIFPFYYRAENRHESSTHYWPFYGHSTKSDGSESWATLYPFFQYRRNATKESSRTDYFWPLGRSYRQGDSSGSYFIPLWWRKTEPGLSGGFVFPYFWHTTEQKQQKAVFPLWYTSRSDEAETDFLLLWYAHRQEEISYRTLFPLYWQLQKNNGNGFSLLVPFYWNSISDNDRFKVIFPFYFRHEDIEHQTTLRYYFPFYGDFKTGEHIRDRYYLFPLYVKVDDPEHQRQAWYFLWPLVYGERTPETFENWAIPFYWITSKQDRQRRMILALYWSNRTPEYEASLLFPFYYRYQSDELSELHYWPFYGRKTSDTYQEKSIIWPLFRWGANPEGDRKAWQLLLAYGKTFPDERLWGLFPLWHHQQDKEKNRDISLLHWQESRVNGDRQFSLLHAAHPDWSIFSIRQRGDEKHHHLFPLYSYSADTAVDNADLWLVGPLYRYERTGADASRHQFLWKVLYSERSTDKKETGFLWRLIRSKKDAESDLFEFNPFYYNERRPGGESYTSWFGGMYTVRENPEGVRKKLFWMLSW